MNAMTELLTLDLGNGRLAERHAKAAARALVDDARTARAGERRWSLHNVLRLPRPARRPFATGAPAASVLPDRAG